MSDRIKELLAVLDMTEKKQISWLKNLYYKNEESGKYDFLIDFYMDSESLADLAFRRRDKVDLVEFERATFRVCKKIKKKEVLSNEKDGWWILKAQPIHWIIAALIAEELAKGDRE
jgi:23S rRNA A2030 N6-methylase RlmJ